MCCRRRWRRAEGPTRSLTGSPDCLVNTSARSSSAAAPAPFRVCLLPPDRWWALQQQQVDRFTPALRVFLGGNIVEQYDACVCTGQALLIVHALGWGLLALSLRPTAR